MASPLFNRDQNPQFRHLGSFHATNPHYFSHPSLQRQVQEACGIDHLCGGMQAGIEGGVHAMHSIWETHKMEEEWGFLLFDTRTAFDEIYRTVMM